MQMRLEDACLETSQAPTGHLRSIGLKYDKANYDLTPDLALQYQAGHETAARSYPHRLPLAIDQADGVWIKDTRGQVFLDCLAAAGALPLGYNHPELNDQIQQQLNSGLPYQTLDLVTPTKVEFMKELLDFLPDPFARNARLQFCSPSGSDANEAAIKLAKLATGRKGIVAFHGGYHGMTTGSLSVTGNRGPKERRTGLMPDVQFVPFPYSLRCPFGLGGEAGARMGLRLLESTLNDVESGSSLPAAFLLEPIQGEGGVIPAPDFWLREIRRITSEHGILLIVDEVQSGIARSGQHFAFEHANITPDIVVMSKAVGGGLPLAVIAFDAAIDLWQSGEHAGTFRGNQLAMATGCTTMKVIRRDNLCRHAAQMGERLMSQLRSISSDCIGEVRGRGLMVGLEIVNGRRNNRFGEPEHDSERAAEIQRQALKRGLIIEKGGRNGSVLRFLPPLIIDADEIDFVARAMAKAVLETEV